jgi:hypothetical protein
MHRRRSRRVFGGGRYAALGEEFTHQVQAGEICPHEFLKLRAGQEHEPSRCFQQDERRSLRKPGPLSQVVGRRTGGADHRRSGFRGSVA